MYDYLIIGAGLFGSVFAQQCIEHKKSVLVIEKRNHIGGNCYSENIENIDVHRYGPHIFHTSNETIWKYINQFSEFNNFIYRPLANFNDKIYSLPFNMFTFNQFWGVVTPKQARSIIDNQKYYGVIENLEDQAISMVGRDIYETLIKGYTQKQWQKDPKELPQEIIKRIPVRFTYDNNYFNDKYQGIPVEGYSRIFEKLLDKADVILDTDYFSNRDYYNGLAKYIVYTGPIDKFYDYKYGKLEYRSLNFESSLLYCDDYQGVAVINYTDYATPYTRIIEHKHFNNRTQNKTIITKEYPINWTGNEEPYYPINTKSNQNIYQKYEILSRNENKIIFGGRLAEYKYYDMHQIIGASLKKFRLTSR